MITGQIYYFILIENIITAFLRCFFCFLHIVQEFLFQAIQTLYFNNTYLFCIKSLLAYFIYNFQPLDLFIRATFQTMCLICYKSMS